MTTFDFFATFLQSLFSNQGFENLNRSFTFTGEIDENTIKLRLYEDNFQANYSNSS